MKRKPFWLVGFGNPIRYKETQAETGTEAARNCFGKALANMIALNLGTNKKQARVMAKKVIDGSRRSM